MVKGKSMKIPLADPLIEEEEAKSVYNVVKSGWIREGETVKTFEEEFAKYVGAKYAIAVSSGTCALHVALLSLGIKPGDEIIVPSFTCAPPVSMILIVGAIPVFADIEMRTYNIDPESVKGMITEKTKVIIPINYAGHPAQLDVLEEIAKEHGLYLLNDAAEALGARYRGKKIAEFGDVTVFSFSPNKTITTGEGGMIVTNNEEIAERALLIKNYGQKKRFWNVEIGSNYKMTEMQAALGLSQLRKIDRIINLKRKNAIRLTQELSDIEGIQTPVELEGALHVYCLYSIRVLSRDRDEVQRKLEDAGIQSRVYFPPMHKMPVMRKYPFRSDTLHNTESVSSTILSLPSSPKLTYSEIRYISEVLHDALRP